MDETAMPARRADSLDPARGEALFETLAARVADGMRRLRVPGVSLGLWSGAREYLSCMGRTSIENPLRVTPETMFQIGSITKTMTATALAMLTERGAFDLDAPVREVLSGFSMVDPVVTERLTTRHLLTHTGGWVGDYFDDFGDGDDALSVMVEHIGRLPQVMPLGAAFSYNNAGFNIASRVLEVVSGRPYEKAIQDLLFGPLGLERSYFYPSDILITHRFAVGHEKAGRRVVVSRPWAIGRAGNGVGGAVMSISDLLAYARFHLSSGLADGGIRVAPAVVVESTRQPSVEAGNRGHVGLSWFVKEIGGVRFVGHGGATNGQQSYMAFVPGHDFAVAILTNSESGGIIADSIRSWAAELWFDAKQPGHKRLPASRQALDDVAGTYELPVSAFTLRRRDDGLVLREIPRGGFPRPDSPAGPRKPPMRAVMLEGDRLLILDEPRKDAIAELMRGPDGRVAFCRLGARIHPKVKGKKR